MFALYLAKKEEKLMGGMGLGLGMGLGGGSATRWDGPLSIRDEFTTGRAAGGVIGTATEPLGLVNRAGVDTESKLSITGGKLVCSGGKASPVQGDPWVGIDSAITRAAGKIGVAKIGVNDATNTFEFGFSNAKTGALVGNSFRVASDTLKPYDGSTAGPTINIPTDATEITLAVILRAAGAYFFHKTGSGFWKIFFSTITNNTSSLYLGASNFNAAPQIDWMRSPFLKWLPTPLLSDNFTRADGPTGTSNGLGHAESTGLGAGGSGVAWSGGAIVSNRMVITPSLGAELASGNLVVGNWYSITATTANYFGTGLLVGYTFRATATTALDASNKVKLITLSSAYAYSAFSTTDVEITAWFTRAAGMQTGVILGLNEAGTSFVKAVLDGLGNCRLVICENGTYTTKSNVAATYVADAPLRVRRTGTELWVWYNNILIGSGPTTTLSAGENANLNGLRCGCFSTNEGNSFSKAVVFASGTNGEYNILDTMIGETTPTATIYDIGVQGKMGFGVAAYEGTLPSGFTGLSGHDNGLSDNYGNYQFSDGSVMCWVPKFYYMMLENDYPDIKPASFFANTAAANAAGYALHRAFIDGGVEKTGFFIDKYVCSKNAKGTGWIASSIANGNPISTASAHNPIGGLTATAGINFYYSAITAAKARDGVNGAVNPNSIFHCASRFQFGAIALLSLAHAKASTDTAANAWYSANNFPKGNNNTLKDINDASVTYTSDGYSSCGKTGSGSPFAATTHNGQKNGVCDINGNMWGVSIGATCIATTVGIEGMSRANPCVVTWAGHGLTTGSHVQIESITQTGWTVLNSKIYSVTYINADSFSLQGVDTSAFGTAYDPGTDPGTIAKGTFYVAKQSTAMKHFTSGNTLGTDHWGVTGCTAMMDIFVPAFETAYPNNGLAQRFGDSTGQVLSAATDGAGWMLTGLGVPRDAAGISTGGTAVFGTDYFYQYIRDAVCLLSGGFWNNGSNAGVWYVSWHASRSASSADVGFRAACYPE